jgi:hypothetical protein
MTGRTIALAALALAGAMGLAAPAWPQDVTAPCRLCEVRPETLDTKPATPISLAVEVNLDFDQLIVGGAGDGSAALGPDGARSISGSITAIGARSMVGEVVIRGEPGALVRVELPGQVELVGLSGGVVRLDSLKSDLPAMPRLDGNGRLRFRIGGVLHLSGDDSGEFRGNLPIEVDYL